MKSIMKSILGLQMTAMFLTVALAGPAAAEKQVPFKGSVQAVESYDVQFPTLFVDTTGTGKATHLGRFTVTLGIYGQPLERSGNRVCALHRGQRRQRLH